MHVTCRHSYIHTGSCPGKPGWYWWGPQLYWSSCLAWPQSTLIKWQGHHHRCHLPCQPCWKMLLLHPRPACAKKHTSNSQQKLASTLRTISSPPLRVLCYSLTLALTGEPMHGPWSLSGFTILWLSHPVTLTHNNTSTGCTGTCRHYRKTFHLFPGCF